MADQCRNYLFTWKIKNFSLCVTKNAECIESPIFRAESIGGSEWYLKLYPRGENLQSNEYVSCYLVRVKNYSKELTKYSLEIIGSDGQILGFLRNKEQIFGGAGWGISKVIAFEELNENIKRWWKKDSLTIRCHLSNYNDPLKQPAIESECCTVLDADRCSFLWNLKFSDIPNWNDSKTFYIKKESVFEFTIASPDNEFDIDVQRLDEEISQVKHVSCKISLMTIRGDEFKSVGASLIFEGDSAQNKWKIPALFSKNDLQNVGSEVMQNDLFTLKCELSVSTGKYVSNIKNVKYEIQTTSLRNSVSALQEDLRNMLKISKNSDVKLCVESLTVPAHKNILSARSPVFSAMFDQNMLENETGIVDIQDLDAMTLNSLLEFVYTGLVSDLTVEKALKLLIAADKYQIPSLTENCSEFLISQLSVENVCDVYCVADLIIHANLKYCALEFVKTKSSELLSSIRWIKWMKENVNLANEILYLLALGSSP